jgi:transcriptional regulator with XRE-family HTH domain
MAARRAPPEIESSPRALRERLGLSRERMARILDTSTKSVERWEAHATTPAAAARERLSAIAQIVDLGLVIYSPEGFQRFLTASIGELSDLTPLQLIEIGQSERVLERLAGDYEGIGF